MTNYRHVSADIMAAALKASKPDPLVDAMAELAYIEPKIAADNLRAALDARGLEIREKNDD